MTLFNTPLYIMVISVVHLHNYIQDNIVQGDYIKQFILQFCTDNGPSAFH